MAVQCGVNGHLADRCDGRAGPDPDVVLLLPDEEFRPWAPRRCDLLEETNEVGQGHAVAGLVREKRQPRQVTIEGIIDRHKGPDGRRRFTGGSSSTYWLEGGTSGSPVFVGVGEQLAGIVSLAERGANAGETHLHEGFVVPGTTIRYHLSRLKAAPTARNQHVPIEDLQPVLDALGAEAVPLAEIPARLTEFIIAAKARAAEPVALSNQGGDIDATIAAARAKLGGLDAAAAHTVLQEKIDEEEATHRRRLVPLLAEKAAIERLSYQHGAAKATLERAACPRSGPCGELDRARPDRRNDRVPHRSRRGVYGRPRGGPAHRRCAGRKRRAGRRRRRSGCAGEFPEALKTFREGLAIRERLAAADPGNAGWQRDLSVSYDRVGDVLVAPGNFLRL